MSPDTRTIDFGGNLRAARERRGITLRQIANATKISVGVLEALERNDISRLPGGIFSRAFVRSYAIEVGLEPEETIQEFVAQFRDDSVTAGHRASERFEDYEAVESSQQTASTFLRLVLVSVPIAAIILYFETSGRRMAPIPRTEPVAAAVTVRTPSPIPAVETTAAPVDTPAADPLPIDRLTVVVAASRECWISLSADGRKITDRLLQAGEQQKFEAEREVVLTAGDAAALVVTVNGAEVKPLGKAGEVVTTRLNLTNFKDYLVVR
jgi:cytoskeletal protein RodZ